MSDHAAFLAAIRAKPDDDLPRLIYADYLDERGAGDRAELIRVQCQLARLRDGMWTGLPAGKRLRRAEARRRWDEYDAIALHQGRLLRTGQLLPAGTPPTVRPVWRRGLLDAIACPWPDCRDHLDGLLGCHPIRRVDLLTSPEIELERRHADRTHVFAIRAGGRVAQHSLADADVLAAADLRVVALTVAPILLGRLWPGVGFMLPPPTDVAADLAHLQAAAGRMARLQLPRTPLGGAFADSMSEYMDRLQEQIIRSLRIPNSLLAPPVVFLNPADVARVQAQLPPGVRVESNDFVQPGTVLTFPTHRPPPDDV